MDGRTFQRSLIALILAIVRSSLATAIDCSNSTTYYINATTSARLGSSFKAPTGPLSNGSNAWTWNLATESYNTETSNTAIRQAVWLDVQPPIDLPSPNLGYLGCGLVVHGLKTSVLQNRANQRSGTCDNMLSSTCVTELLNGTTEYAEELSHSESVPIADICKEFRTLGGAWKALGVTSKCSDDFTSEAWIETFPFASPELASLPDCPPKNNVPAALFSWGSSTYSGSNFTSYDNLTQSITPLISVMFVNHTIDSNTTLGYSQSQLSCLHPDIVNGSRVPTTPIPSGAGNPSLIRTGLLLTVFVGLLNLVGA